MRKMKNEALPSQDIIKEVDLYSYADPYALIASHEFMAKEYEWYFFTRRNKRHVNGSRVNRRTSNGFWKASGGEKPIHHNGEIVGKKMSLVFHYNGTSSKPEKTNWLMQEFKLETDDKKGDDWVICKVYNIKDNLQITPGVQEFSCNANYSEAQPMPIDDEVQKVCGYSNQEGFEQSNQVMESSSDSTFQQHLEKNDGPIFEGMFSDEDINNPNLSAPIDLLFNEEDRLFIAGLYCRLHQALTNMELE
ncbi:hypothetical protein Leryth_013258 [Lithospermum erythrorhizon]|nr:hypothetical protein Leryth_013258 [Lithospermum erythrorhizon]